MAASSSRSKGIASSSSSAAESSSAAAVPAALPSPRASRQVKLEKENELRIEVGSKFQLKLKLLSGTAEIFGHELDLYCWNIYPPRMKFAVFTWDGATIEIKGITDREYITDETPMRSYRHVHNTLEERRNLAANNPDSHRGPRVIVVGPQDSGKTSLCKMLLGWAAKLDRIPLFVDLDVDQGSITVPGCMGAIPIHTPIDPVIGIPIDNNNNPPLVFFYGHTSPSADVELYKFLLRRFSAATESRFLKSTKTRAAGMIINTMGRIDGVETSVFLRHVISTFRASVVLVVDHEEELYNTLNNALKDTPAAVLKLQKSGGVVSRNSTIRSEARNFKVREYFYGPGGDDIAPDSHTANFWDFDVFRIGNWAAQSKVVSAVCETLSDQHRNQILAVSFATKQPDILSSSIIGFIYVKAVDVESKTFTYLTATEKDVPRRQHRFFSPIEEEIPMRRLSIFEPVIPRRQLTFNTPPFEVVPNNCLIFGSVRANLEEYTPPMEEEEEEEDFEEEYIPVSYV